MNKEMKTIVNMPYGQIFQIGKPFEEGVTNYPEGIKFDFSKLGATTVITVDGPTRKEIRDINSGQLKMAISLIDNMIFVNMKFGGSLWMEAPFHIALSQLSLGGLGGSPLPILAKDMGYLMIVFLVDTKSGIVKVMRQISLSHDFCIEFANNVDRQLKMTFDEKVYYRNVNRIWDEFRRGDILKRADYIYELNNGEWNKKKI